MDGVEAGVVLQAEHEDDGVHPGSKLKKRMKREFIKNDQDGSNNEKTTFRLRAYRVGVASV